MAAPTAAKLRSQFETEMRQLVAVAASGAGSATPRDVTERLLEAVFLNAVTAFESFLEQLFFKSVTGAVRTGGIKPVTRLKDEDTARRMIIRPREKYVTWLPIEDAISRADVYLVSGKPFSRVATRGAAKGLLTRALTVRNAIAHRSGHAKVRFDEMVGGRHATAGAYLAAASGGGRMCEEFLAELGRLVHGLCASDEAQAEHILGPPDPIPAGAKPGAGNFVCLVCASAYTIVAGQALECAVCDPRCTTCGSVVSRTARFRAD